jgi:hypothetical protein
MKNTLANEQELEELLPQRQPNKAFDIVKEKLLGYPEKEP